MTIPIGPVLGELNSTKQPVENEGLKALFSHCSELIVPATKYDCSRADRYEIESELTSETRQAECHLVFFFAISA